MNVNNTRAGGYAAASTSAGHTTSTQKSSSATRSFNALPLFSQAAVGSIVRENASCLAPKQIPMATSQLLTCRTLVVFGEHSNFMVHINEHPDSGSGHTISSMRQTLKKVAQQLDMRESELAHRKVTVMAGPYRCDEIDLPLRYALNDYRVNADWHAPENTDKDVYAVAQNDTLYLGSGEQEEAPALRTGVIMGRL